MRSFLVFFGPEGSPGSFWAPLQTKILPGSAQERFSLRKWAQTPAQCSFSCFSRCFRPWGRGGSLFLEEKRPNARTKQLCPLLLPQFPPPGADLQKKLSFSPGSLPPSGRWALRTSAKNRPRGCHFPKGGPKGPPSGPSPQESRAEMVIRVGGMRARVKNLLRELYL